MSAVSRNEPRPLASPRCFGCRSACEDHQRGGRGQPLITSCRSVSRTLRSAHSLCDLALKFVGAAGAQAAITCETPPVSVTESKCYAFLHGKREHHGRSG